MISDAVISKAPRNNDQELSTLVELLRWRASLHPYRQVFSFQADGEEKQLELTYGELDRHARALAVQLLEQGNSGERVLLLYAPGLDYIIAFFGCLYAGMIAVPVYPPHPARMERTLPRLLSIIRNARPTIALTTSDIHAMIGMMLPVTPDFANMRWLATDAIPEALAYQWQQPSFNGDSLVFLQYTSGSTGTPRGVMLSHSNLLANLMFFHARMELTPEARGVFWLPFYHDMGLIGGVLGSVYTGLSATLMSPIAFLQRPLRWLQTISRVRATISGGPNFAYDLCVSKIKPDQRATLDLSSWTVAFNGAEPVRAETLKRFTAAFAPYGFRPEAFYPCYGLAEATLFVSGGKPAAQPIVCSFSMSDLERNQVRPADDEQGGRALVSCGAITADQIIRIVDPETHTLCKPDEIGEIWVAGQSVAQGYWERPEETEYAFRATIANNAEGPFLRTGDLGFLHEGELFVTGRMKDLIIIRGLNHYPQDIELTTERSHAAIRTGCIAAFAIDANSEERLVIVAEVNQHYSPAQLSAGGDTNASDDHVTAITQCIRQAVAKGHDLQAHEIVLIKAGSIPKTSSGKLQRYACRNAFLERRLQLWSS